MQPRLQHKMFGASVSVSMCATSQVSSTQPCNLTPQLLCSDEVNSTILPLSWEKMINLLVFQCIFIKEQEIIKLMFSIYSTKNWPPTHMLKCPLLFLSPGQTLRIERFLSILSKILFDLSLDQVIIIMWLPKPN